MVEAQESLPIAASSMAIASPSAASTGTTHAKFIWNCVTVFTIEESGGADTPVYVSIDASEMAVHEENRGLKGLGERIRSATARMPSLGMTALAQVTMSKLIGDYRTLVPLLRNLGFSAVAFSYPQQARLGSSSLAWSSDSRLVNFKSTELVEAFDAVDDLRSVFPVNNPRASVADMKQHLRGQPERFVCYGGYKSFYMDWNFDMWRCDAWDKRMCSVWEFAEAPLIRDGCTACIADCYPSAIPASCCISRSRWAMQSTAWERDVCLPR
jgi:hypothetical protein